MVENAGKDKKNLWKSKTWLVANYSIWHGIPHFLKDWGWYLLAVSWVWTLTCGWGWRCRRYWGVAHSKSFKMCIIVEISRFGRPNRSCNAGFNVPENVPLKTPDENKKKKILSIRNVSWESKLKTSS